MQTNTNSVQSATTYTQFESIDLRSALETLPDEWKYTPVKGNKAPYTNAWQNNPFTKEGMISCLISENCKGIGLMCGTQSGGLLLLDHDGASADQKILELSGSTTLEEALPPTVAVTSGLPGRYQSIYSIPQVHWDDIKTKKYATGIKTWNEFKQRDDVEQVEFRWDGCQSVIAGEHPQTGSYKWLPGRSPSEIAIATAPAWMIASMQKDKPKAEKAEKQVSKHKSEKTTIAKSDDVSCARKYLKSLNPTRADDYDDWIKVGQCLHSVSDVLLGDWIEWSAQSMKFKDGDCEDKWDSFDRDGEYTIATLNYLARIDNKSDKPVRMGMISLLEFLPRVYGGSLRFNELTQAVEVEGTEILVEDAYVILAQDLNVNSPKAMASDAFIAVAKGNTFHPVRDYLNAIEDKPKAEIDTLATRYLGTNNALYNVFLKKTLIAAVARIYNPGCKVDTTLVLQGKQGVGKSTFFDVLGGDWFDDSMGNGSDKDDLLILHKCWLQEWGELERVFSKKQAGELKSFLSRREDTYRAPYARSTASRKRMSIIVGSVNNAQFLVDPTGDRRYWVVPIGTSKIDTVALKAERDSIWSAAIAAYKTDQQWWLSNEEQTLSNENNSQFRDRDEWETEIENYLSDKQQVAIKELLVNCFGFESNGKMDRSIQYRVKNALTALGWSARSNPVNHTWRDSYKGNKTERMRVWENSDTSNTSKKECAKGCASQNPYGARVSTSNTSNTSFYKDLENIEKREPRTLGDTPHTQNNESLEKNVSVCVSVSEPPKPLPVKDSSMTHTPTHQAHQKKDVSELQHTTKNILCKSTKPKKLDDLLLLVQTRLKWEVLTAQELEHALDNLLKSGEIEKVNDGYQLGKF